MAQGYAFSFRERQTKKKGVVYDVIFRIIDENGCEVQKSLCGYQTKALAKQAYTEFMATYIAPPKRYNGKQQLTFDYALENYYGSLKATVKESSLYTVMNSFKIHITPFFTGKDMTTIKAETVYAWQDALWSKVKQNGQPYSQTQLRKIRSEFCAFVHWCVKRYNIKDFISTVEAPKRRYQKREYTIWTKEQFMQFYSVIDNERYKAIFYTLFFSGIRCGELQALTPADYNGKDLTIKTTYNRYTLDGTPYKITPTKNYKPHKVPLPAHACAILDSWLEYKKKNGIANNFIFGSEHPISKNPIQYALDKYTKLANLSKIRIHDFRHSYVSMLLSNGTNFAVIAKLIGDTIEQVVKTYSHLINDDLVKAIENL